MLRKIMKQEEKNDALVLEHMLGYIDEHDKQHDDMFDLGYLDYRHWVDAVNVLPAHLLPSLLKLAKEVDERYNTSFLDDVKGRTEYLMK